MSPFLNKRLNILSFVFQKSNPAIAVRANADAAFITELSVHMFMVIPAPYVKTLTTYKERAYYIGVGASFV